MSSERAFLKLSSSLSPEEARELLKMMKTSGVADAAKSFLKNYRNELGAAALGTAILSGIQYATSKNKDKAGVSTAQKAFSQPAEKERKNMSFAEDLGHFKDKAMADFADVGTRHPFKSSMFVAPTGAAAGLATLAMIRRLKGV